MALQANGQPVANATRNLWVTETALATALNVSFMAERLSLFSIVIGIALLLSGIGLRHPRLRRAPPQAQRRQPRRKPSRRSSPTASHRLSPVPAEAGASAGSVRALGQAAMRELECASTLLELAVARRRRSSGQARAWQPASARTPTPCRRSRSLSRSHWLRWRRWRRRSRSRAGIACCSGRSCAFAVLGGAVGASVWATAWSRSRSRCSPSAISEPPAGRSRAETPACSSPRHCCCFSPRLSRRSAGGGCSGGTSVRARSPSPRATAARP